MLGIRQLLGNAKGWASGIRGSMSSGAGGLLGKVDTSSRFQKAVGGTLGFMEANPGLVGAGIGAAGGYAGSGTFGGALVGAGFGAIGGRRGLTGYNSKRKGQRTQYSAKLGRKITGSMPGLSHSIGPNTKQVFTSSRSGGRVINNRSGNRRNLGGKRLGSHAIGAGLIGGTGLFAGAIWGAGTGAITSAGSTFGSQARAVYGNAFSGMGNGTITSY